MKSLLRSTLAAASGNNAGLWMEGSRTIRFSDMDSARGSSVPARTYNVYPNLKPGTGSANVSVSFSCPG